MCLFDNISISMYSRPFLPRRVYSTSVPITLEPTSDEQRWLLALYSDEPPPYTSEQIANEPTHLRHCVGHTCIPTPKEMCAMTPGKSSKVI